MSNLEKLLEGVEVEWKMLGEIGTFYGGLTGKNKSDFSDGNAKFITYMNVFTNMAVNVDINTLVRIGKNESQNKVEYGDVLFTGSSETPNECGMSSVMTTKTEEIFYLNSFCFGFRLTDKTLFSPDFLKFLFRDEKIRKQISKTASGVTRFNVSKARFSKITIPIPPLEIQNEIVRILDKFSTLTAELQAELQARKSQYEYYRNELLDYPMEESDQPSLRSSRSATSIKESDNPMQPQSAQNPPADNSVLPPRGKVEWKTLGELGELIRGNGLQKKDFTESGIGCIHYGQIYTYYGTYTYKTKTFVTEELAEKLQKVDQGDVVITNTSENIEDVGKAVAYLGKEQIVTGGHATIFKPSNKIIGKYLVYLTQTETFAFQKRKLAKGTKVIDVSASDMSKIIIPIPPLSEQARIVSILDKFDTLTNSITDGLPKEIALRQKQYEYYRDMLLTFNRKA